MSTTSSRSLSAKDTQKFRKNLFYDFQALQITIGMGAQDYLAFGTLPNMILIFSTKLFFSFFIFRILINNIRFKFLIHSSSISFIQGHFVFNLPRPGRRRRPALVLHKWSNSKSSNTEFKRISSSEGPPTRT